MLDEPWANVGAIREATGCTVDESLDIEELMLEDHPFLDGLPPAAFDRAARVAFRRLCLARGVPAPIGAALDRLMDESRREDPTC